MMTNVFLLGLWKTQQAIIQDLQLQEKIDNEAAYLTPAVLREKQFCISTTDYIFG